MEHFDLETNEKTVFKLPTDRAEQLNLLESCSKSIVQKCDFISNRILNTPAPVLAQPLRYLKNRCLSEGVFLNFFKSAKVLPINKSVDVDAVQNCRPISIFPSHGKVIEKVVFLFSHVFSIFRILNIYFAKSKSICAKLCRHYVRWSV